MSEPHWPTGAAATSNVAPTRAATGVRKAAYRWVAQVLDAALGGQPEELRLDEAMHSELRRIALAMHEAGAAEAVGEP